ncbi:MAG: hypothetical protein JXB20_02330 [Bacilli bacterium]|nr:hypothetical protein [Bacilli bacterium]MBN2695947.1 hypothetical protein [Bacilli bacterium]
MKKAIGVMMMALLVFLAIGCDNSPTTIVTTESTGTTTITTTLPPTTTTTREPVVHTTELISFVNYSEEFIKTEPIDDITFHYFSWKNGIPYVDITEFVTMLLEIIDPNIQITIEEDTVKVWYEYFYTEDEKLEYGIDEDSFLAYVLFDFANNRIEATNVEASDYFTGESETDYSEGIEMVSYTEEEMPLLDIDILEYDFMFFKLEEGEEVKYTIPLSLAGLFLTGANYYVVHNGSVLHGLDIFQIYDVTVPDSPESAAVALNQDVTEEQEEESRKFLELCFDHFYGLKEYKGIESFSEYTETYFPSDSFEKSFTNFVDSLEDLHTGVLSYGHNNPGYYHGVTPQYIYNYSYEYYGCECHKNPSNFKLSFYKDMAYLRITEFTADLKDSLAPKMAEIAAANPEYVVIDLACNGGGFVHGVLYLLNYLTNEDIPFYYMNVGARSSETYEIDGDMAIDAEFFFVTSRVTYSAANLTVSIAKEMDLARTIGSKSGGGACYVKYLVLPNGAIMQMSSNTNITFSDYETVEAGLDSDYMINFYSAGRAYYEGYSDDPDYPSLIEFYTIVKSMDEEVTG